jgi:multidrug transporter EmrE-like cation transporter
LVLISTAAGYAFFKEKLKAVQILGMMLGIISIVIIGCSNIILGLF